MTNMTVEFFLIPYTSLLYETVTSFSPATKSSAGISLVAVPFSSKSTVYSLSFTLMVTVPVALGMVTTTLLLDPIQTDSAVTVTLIVGILFSTTLLALLNLTAPSPLWELETK